MTTREAVATLEYRLAWLQKRTEEATKAGKTLTYDLQEMGALKKAIAALRAKADMEREG